MKHYVFKSAKVLFFCSLLAFFGCEKEDKEGNSDSNRTEIYYRWTENLSNPTGNGHWCDWSAQSYYRNSHPDIPDQAVKDMYYGPCKAGTFHFYLDTSGATGGYNYQLIAPAPGYKRYYSHRIKEYESATNKCVFVSKLTYRDEPIK